MPDDNNPDGPVLEPVKEPIGCDDDLAEREVGELRDESARLGELFEARERLLCFLPETPGGVRIISVNVGEGLKELPAARRGKEDSQGFEASRKRSASFKTSSSSQPTPASISFSPRASSRRMSSSCWDSS